MPLARLSEDRWKTFARKSTNLTSKGLKESATTTEEESLLRQEVFERLNTGGVKLSYQEIRNALYPSKFNILLFELVRNAKFRKIWGLPPYSESAEKSRARELITNASYVLMRDVEFVLRFFALRHVQHYRRGMKGFLDVYMIRARTSTDGDVHLLKDLFNRTVELGWSIYGEHLGQPWDISRGSWAGGAHLASADAVMVSLSRHLDEAAVLANKRDEVIESAKRLFEKHPAGTFTGRGCLNMTRCLFQHGSEKP